MTRDEHVAWCKQQAREYLRRGDLVNAVASMSSDMDKREDCKVNAYLILFAGIAASNGDYDGVERYIEGFR